MPTPNTGATTPQGAATPATGTGTPEQKPPQQQQQAQPGQTGTQEPGGNTVPISVMHREREQRQEAQAQLSELQGQLAEMKLMLQQQQQGFPQQQQQQYPQQQQQMSRNPLEQVWEDPLWDTDPKAAVRRATQTEVMTALSWYDQQHVAVSQQESAAMQKHQDYGQYKDRVDAYLRSIPLDRRSQPGTVEMAYFVVKGQNTDQILSRSNQELLEKIRRGEQVQGLSPGTFAGPAAGTQQGQLTEDQMKAAAMMNMTPDEYAKYMTGGK